MHLDTRYRHPRASTPTSCWTRSPSTGIRRAFPTLRSRGELRGPFQSQGTLGPAGGERRPDRPDRTVEAHGFATLQPPQWGAEDLLLRFSRLDLGALTGRDLHQLARTASCWSPAVIDTAARTRGRDASWRFPAAGSGSGPSTASSRVAGAARQRHPVDTAYAVWKGARAEARVRWAGPRRTRGEWRSPSRPTA